MRSAIRKEADEMNIIVYLSHCTDEGEGGGEGGSIIVKYLLMCLSDIGVLNVEK